MHCPGSWWQLAVLGLQMHQARLCHLHTASSLCVSFGQLRPEPTTSDAGHWLRATPTREALTGSQSPLLRPCFQRSLLQALGAQDSTSVGHQSALPGPVAESEPTLVLLPARGL